LATNKEQLHTRVTARSAYETSSPTASSTKLGAAAP
jgi:hypothetical protein